MPRSSSRLAPILIGVLLVVAGLGIVGYGVYQKLASASEANHLQQNNDDALAAWNSGGSAKLAGAASGPSDSTATCGGSSSSTAYALIKFTGIPQYGYAGVAADGDWNALNDHPMVHWHGSADPGGQGNVIVAFHREPNFQHVDQLGAGGTITLQDRNCHTYVYTVTKAYPARPPDQVKELVNTDGHQLTMITCTPWWQDYDRLVWRASLTSVDGHPFSG